MVPSSPLGGTHLRNVPVFSNILSTMAFLWLGSMVPYYSDGAGQKGALWIETVFPP